MTINQVIIKSDHFFCVTHLIRTINSTTEMAYTNSNKRTVVPNEQSGSTSAPTIFDDCVNRRMVHNENMNCILHIYRTTQHQIQLFQNHLNQRSCPENNLSIDVNWEIEVADEFDGWFTGYALSFNARNHTIYIVVPDKQNPTFEGVIDLDYRIVRLLNCLDNYSHALFNKIVRNHIYNIDWEIDWIDFDNNSSSDGVARYSDQSRTSFYSDITSLASDSMDSNQPSDQSHGKKSAQPLSWIHATARYYIPINNTLLIEESSTVDGKSNKSLINLYIDHANIRLCYCHRYEQFEYFERLIFEESVKCTARASKQIRHYYQYFLPATSLHEERHSQQYIQSIVGRHRRPKEVHRTEQESSDRDSSCVICFEESITNIAYIPCGHQSALPCVSREIRWVDQTMSTL